MDKRHPLQIPESDRWYFCEELDPVYGNLLSRDLVSFIIYCVCRIGKGVEARQQVYLDITHLHTSRGGPHTREIINDKLEGVLEIYEKFMRVDPIENPMKIYPAQHYTMGGLWVDYEKGHEGPLDPDSPRNQQTNIPGLYAAGECEYQYHGANRLGANALLSCLTGGELTALGVLAYVKDLPAAGNELSSAVLDEAKNEQTAKYQTLITSKGTENPYRLHAELTDVMWNNCGIWRKQKDLLSAKEKLDELATRAHQCKVIDGSEWSNQAVPFTRGLQNMIEMSKAIVGGAIIRDESRGAHFKMDTPERDDDKWLVTTKAIYTEKGPEFDLTEKVECNYISPRPRKYRINQIKVVREIMGEEYLTDNAPQS